MKTVPKILIYFFLIVFILQLAILLFLLLVPRPSQAVDFTPQVGIDETFQKGKPYPIPESTKAIGEYVRAIYKYAIGIVGILAAVVLMLGGIIWLTAGGNTERISNAKAWIGASLTGLILALCSYMILATINPKLVEFEPIKIAKVTNDTDSDNASGCCVWSKNSIASALPGSGGTLYNNKQDGVASLGECKRLAGQEEYDYAINGQSLDMSIFGTGALHTYKCITTTPSQELSDCGPHSGRQPGDLCFTAGARVRGYCSGGGCARCKSTGEDCDNEGQTYECCSRNCIDKLGWFTGNECK